MKTVHKILAVLLAISFLTVACGKKKPEIVPPIDGTQSRSSAAGSAGTSAGTEAFRPAVPDVSAKLSEAIKKNTDVIGWLMLPGTSVNEPVVQTTNNDYYLRRDYLKNYAYEGCYYMDYESVMFDEGADLAQNTIIYGHNLGNPKGAKDDPNGVKFAALLKLNDETFAQDTPYIYLATPSKTHIFEVFAAFYCEERLTPVPYHLASYTEDRLMTLASDAKSRSTFTYDVSVDPQDKLLTLSTCTYKYGTYTQNPHQRFVVMARLVQEGETFQEKAKVTVNQSPKQPKF